MEKFEEKRVGTETLKKELPRNVKIIETPEAKFRVMYAFHNVAQKPEEMGDADALIVETGSRPYSNNEEAEKELVKWAENKQYKAILHRAQNEQKPVFLVDISEADLVLILQHNLKAVEPIVGAGLLFSLASEAISKYKKGRQLNRREFMKKLGKGLLGLYFSTYTPSIVKDFAGQKAEDMVDKFIIDLNERIHPETDAILITLRNHLIAHKTKTIASLLKLEVEDRKPEIALAIGFGHRGIEDALESEDKERIETIQKLIRMPGLSRAARRVADIAQLEFDVKRNRLVATKIFKDPALVEIQK